MLWPNGQVGKLQKWSKVHRMRSKGSEGPEISDWEPMFHIQGMLWAKEKWMLVLQLNRTIV